MPDGLSSLDLLLSEVRAELDQQLRHFEGLDSKAGIILGFAGAVVALTSRRSGVFSSCGQAIAVAAALFSLFAFFPRRYPVMRVRALRDRYLRAHLKVTKLFLMDTQIAMVEQASRLLRAKSRLLATAAGLLLTSVAFVAAGNIFRARIVSER